ncbi:MAG: leucyl/phenylalanyl-tRNA--protein transferase [Balneolaceae bacterium]|nr:leucyl/phenylalanyl-tRNA--protein transferase [Balneolaceae bacterium]
MRIIPPEALLEAYSKGIFPMADSKDAEGVEWYSASQRGIIPINEFHSPKNVQRIVRQGRFEIRVNHNFRKVVKECANRETTWINNLILDSYTVLSQLGHAYSVECYRNNELEGGLYGVKLGGAFFGESMFRKAKEADKVALQYCHQILEQNNFILWDTQFYNDYLGRFGCIEVDTDEYNQLLQQALEKECEFKLA